ncbi:MAG: M20/M25/M40 family metallo-hydrolase, partial [Methanocellales archaeon]
MEKQLSIGFKFADERIGKAIAILMQLLAIDTSNPPGKNYAKIVNFLEPKFKALGFETKRITVPRSCLKEIPYRTKGRRVNLVAWKKQDKSKENLTIYAHLDVVPPGENWTFNPHGEIANGRVYGRGTSDMKGSIASLLIALEIMHELEIKPAFNLLVVLCTDEEIGGYPGLLYLARNGYIPKETHVLCLEGTQDPKILLCTAGSIDATITATGKSCHTGSNFLGVNALEEMIPVLYELLKLKREVEKRETRIPREPHPNSPKFVSPMFNLSMISSGIKSNIVPDKCRLIINRRYTHEESYEEVIAEIKKVVEKAREKSNLKAKFNVEFFHAYPPLLINTKTHYHEKMKQAFKLAQGYKDEDFIEAGASYSEDIAFLQRELGIDKIVYCGLGRA